MYYLKSDFLRHLWIEDSNPLAGCFNGAVGAVSLLFALASSDCQLQWEISSTDYWATVGPISMIPMADPHEIFIPTQ